MAIESRTKENLQDVFDRNKYNLKDAAQNSMRWYAQQAKLMGKQGYTSKRLLSGISGDWAQVPIPGKLYMYAYDAKHKATLPYWDKYPLTFPFKLVKDGLPYKRVVSEEEKRIEAIRGVTPNVSEYSVDSYAYRIKILNDLVGIKLRSTSKHYKLQLSWELISSVAKYQPLQSCVHRYLYSQLRTGLRIIHSSDWATAMMLPTHKFIGASPSYVWKQ